MREGLAAAVAFVFDELNLHRVEANHSRQQAQRRAPAAAGLRRRGLARDYWHIDARGAITSSRRRRTRAGDELTHGLAPRVRARGPRARAARP